MRVVIDGRSVRLDLRKVLGEGGEATVILVADRGRRTAVKLYKSSAAPREAKVSALIETGRELVGVAVLPHALVYEESSGTLLGYAMPALEPGFEPVALLAKESFRSTCGLDAVAVLRLLESLRASTGILHAAGIVVGDLNDQNELVQAREGRVIFVDTDSFQIAGHTCNVATEAFLDPLLYGPNAANPCLTSNGGARWYGRGNDWYAFAVIAFRSLTGVHPFGGCDAALPTLCARAAARKSVFSAGVTLPTRARTRIDALSPELATAFLDIFEGGDRRPFPPSLLERTARAARVCGCGQELLGAVSCPSCSARSAAGAGASAARRLRVRDLASTTGAFINVVTQTSGFAALAREQGDLVLVRGTWDGGEASRAPVRSALAPGALALLTSELVLIATPGADFADVSVVDAGSGKLLLETTTEIAFGRPAIAAAGSVVYRIARGMLMAASVGAASSPGEKTVTSVVSEQTMLHSGRSGVLAVTQVFGGRSYRWIAGAAQSCVDLDVETLAAHEVLLDDAFYDIGERAALFRNTRLAGRERIRSSVFDLRGRRLAERIEDAGTRAAGVAIRGGVLAAAGWLVAADVGLCRIDLGPRPPLVFPETEPFVVLEAPLAVSSHGVLAAVGSSLRLLSLETP